MLQFSSKQKMHIETGALKRKRLLRLAEKAANPLTNSIHPHYYIYSPPGLGKTFTIEQSVKNTGIDYHVVSGNQSMFAFGISLAVINQYTPKDKTVLIIIDDCDEILKNAANINIMKNVLTGNKVYAYEKSLQSQWNNLSDIQKIAIEAHSDDDKMGFVVPTERFVFIFTSNFKLPTDDDVLVARERGLSKANHLSHLNAIRSRCRPGEFDLSADEQWGWIADVILNEDCVNLTDSEKIILLDWMYNNWDNMTEKSIRTAEKMAESMVDDPTGYRDDWEIDYLK
jgi:hypothetical protein